MMSHVDEGALHAYLDGALDEYPAHEAERVREHLEVCAACRERLEAERRVRDEAASILSLAAPEVEAPSFEELRAYVRANASGPTPGSVRLYRLGWAASVVLALGTGWLLRGGEVVPVASPERAATVAPSPALEPSAGAQEAAPAESPSEALVTDTEPAQGGTRESTAPASGSVLADAAAPAADETLAETPPLTPATANAAPTDEVRLADDATRLADAAAVARAESLRQRAAELTATTQRRSLAVPITEPRAQVAPEPPIPDATTAVDADAPAAAGAGAADRTEPDRPRSPAGVVTSADVVAVAPAAGLGRSAGLDDVRDDAAVDEEEQARLYPLVVPGLELLDLRQRGDRRPQGQLVLQRLESGDTLEIFHLPEGVEPAALEVADPGVRELQLQIASGWIVMRAPVEELELLGLMERLLGER